MRATRVKHMRFRLQSTKPRGSRRQRNFSRSVCTVHWEIMGGSFWRMHCAGLRERDVQSRTL
jgi:hypothetical protein